MWTAARSEVLRALRPSESGPRSLPRAGTWRTDPLRTTSAPRLAHSRGIRTSQVDGNAEPANQKAPMKVEEGARQHMDRLRPPITGGAEGPFKLGRLSDLQHPRLKTHRLG